MALNSNRGLLDISHILQRSFDESNDSLRVNAAVTVNVDATVSEIVITHVDDSIRLGDGTYLTTVTVNGPKRGLDVNLINNNITSVISDGTDTLSINADGSINVNIRYFAHTSDSIRLGDGTSFFTSSTVGPKIGLDVNLLNATLPLPTGASTEAKQDTIITNLGNLYTLLNTGTLKVDDDQTQTLLNTINTTLSSLSVTVSNEIEVKNDSGNPLSVTLADEPIKMSGTEDGTPSGTEFTFVNNKRKQILDAKDRDQTITYADFGTKDQRITQIDYTAPSIGVGAGNTARKTFTYVLDGSKYRRTNITWSLI